MAKKWFHSDEVAIKVSIDGRPFKIEFFDPVAAKEARDGKRDKLVNKDRIAPSVSPKGKEFTSSTHWRTKIKNVLHESPAADFSKDEAQEIVDNFFMSAEDALEPMLESEEEEEEDGEEKDDGLDQWSEELLNSPDLVSMIDTVMHHHLKGETKNAWLSFLTILSSKLYIHDELKTGMPLNLGPTGESSVGKSLVEGEMVSVSNSSLATPIEDIESPNKALQSNGINEVHGVAEIEHDGKVLEIKTRSGRTVTCTPGHSLLTWNDGLTPVSADSIEKNNLLPVVGKIDPKEEKKEIESWKKTNPPYDTVSTTYQLNYSLGFIIGIYLAEGSTRQGTVIISCHDGELKKEIIELAEKHSINFCEREEEVLLYDTALLNLIEKDFGKVDSKQVPGWVLETSQRFIDGMLEGYMSGDADTYGGFTSQCKPLRDGIVQLLLTKDVKCTLKEREIDGKTYYKAEMCRHDYHRWPKLHHKEWKYTPGKEEPKDKFTAYPLDFYESLNENNELYRRGSETRKWSGSHNTICKEKGWVSRYFLLELMKHCDNVPDELDMVKDRRMWFDPVIEVNEKEYSGKVYDLQTESSNFSTSEGLLVHNSFIVMGVKEVFPDDMILTARDFSKNAIWHMSGKKYTDEEGNPVKEVDLSGKCIIITEEEGAEDFLRTIRPVLSRDETESKRPIGPMGDEDKTLFAKLLGWPSYIGLSVSGKIEEQEKTRRIRSEPHSGPEKYYATQRWDAEVSETPWLDNIRTTETKIVRRAISKLEPYRVLIPNRKNLQRAFPSSRKEHQRHWNYFKSLIETVVLLYQYQRPKLVLRNNGVEKRFLVATPDDVEIAIKLGKSALESTLAGLGPKERRFWKAIKEESEAEHEYDEEHPVKGYSGLMDLYEEIFGEDPPSETTLRRRYVEPLCEMGLIEVDEGQGREPHHFYVSRDVSFLTFNTKKVLDNCRKLDFDNSTFGDLCYRSSHSAGDGKSIAVRGVAIDELRDTYEVEIVDCEQFMGENPVNTFDKENMERLWDSFLEMNTAKENKEVLERDYEADYGVKEKEKEKEKGEEPEISISAKEEDEKEEDGKPKLKLSGTEENGKPALSLSEAESKDSTLDFGRIDLEAEKKEVYNLMKDEFARSTEDIADELDMTIEEAERCLKELYDEGVLEKKLGKKSNGMKAYYHIAEDRK